MTTKQKPAVNLEDYLPEREKDDEIEQVDLNFGFGDEDDDGEDDSRGKTKAREDEDEDETAPGDEGEGEGEGDKAGGDKDGKSNAKADKDAGKDKAKAEEKPKKHMVPKDRLDKVLARNRELEERLARAEAATAKPEKKDGEKAPAKFDFDAAEDDYQDAVLEGNKTKAKEIRNKIRQAERAELAAEMDAKTSNTSAADRTKEAILEATGEIERQFPVLDSNSKEYNEDAANEMIELYTGMVAAGKSPLAALDKALKYVVKEYNLVNDEVEDDTPAPKKDVKDKVKAAKSQPPKMPTKEEPKKKAVDPDEIDVANMDEDEWDALPESTKARLRGDILA